MVKLIRVLLAFITSFSVYSGHGQTHNNSLSSELFEKEFPVLRSFKNKRIAEIESLRDRMLLVPTNTDDGAAMWREFLDFARQSLISFPLDTYDKDDENYWSRIIATITSCEG